MAKTNIIRLLSLFLTRYSINVSEIKEVCKVSKRTVYRYINALSEANFPIYYDRKVKGYRLNKTFGLTFDKLSPEEIIYICIGLKLLSKRVNDLYHKELDELVLKIFTMQKLSLNDLWEIINSDIENTNLGEDVSSLVTSSIMHYAILYQRGLRVDFKNAQDSNNNINIEKPAIHFQEHWQLSNSQSTDDLIIPISEINKVKTLRIQQS